MFTFRIYWKRVVSYMQIRILQGLTLSHRAFHQGRWKQFLVTVGEPAEKKQCDGDLPRESDAGCGLRLPRRAEERSLLVQHNVDGNLRKQRLEFGLVAERSNERAIFQFR